MTPSAGRGAKPDRETLIESHLPLVRAIATRYAGRGETVEDLIQVGALALIRASDRFDPSRGVPFGTFATPAVEGEIRRHLGDQTGPVRIPRELRRMSGELERTRASLAASLGRAPSMGELASALGIDEEEVEQALKATQARESAPSESGEVLDAASTEPLQATDDRLLVAEGVQALNERERHIVLLRFHADMTEREIAREVGMSQAQVSRLLARALAKLREQLDETIASTAPGDSTESPVISVADAANAGRISPQMQRKTQAGETSETRIAAVDALEEQGRRAGAAEAPEKDLDLPYHVTVKRESDDHLTGWAASLDELPGCEARGATPDQAVENLQAAMQTWLSAAVEEPRVIAPPRSSAKRKTTSSHSGRFLVRMPSALHEELSRAAAREQVSLNRFVTSQLAASVAAPGSPGASALPTTRGDATPAPATRPARNLRVLLAANLLVIIVAAAAAIALLVLALDRGI